AHDAAVWSVRELGDELCHEGDIGRPERPEAEVDERAAVGFRWRPRRVGRANARLEVPPGLCERAAARIVELGRVEREVEPGRLVDQLGLRQRRRTALDAELGEGPLQVADLPRVLR